MSVVVIAYDSTDITEHVVFSTVRFESSVNGAAGPASMRIRDLTGSATYADGKTLTPAAVETLAKTPSLPETRAMLLALINTPASQIARAIQAHVDAENAKAAA